FVALASSSSPRHGPMRAPHSFPTRRSSDLEEANRRKAERLYAQLPTIVAVDHRRRHGLDPIAPTTDLGYAANFFRMVFDEVPEEDRKSTRLNSSHVSISYAVFCLKKKTQQV